jgi:carboxyl-terminal processing protease
MIALTALAVGLLAPRADGYHALDTFIEVYTEIREHWVDKVDEAALVQGAIRGMVGALDPHSEYLSPDLVKEFRDTTRGRYAGIGLELSSRDGRLLVVAPIDGSPAARAGVRAGDVILGVDGKDAGEMQLADAVRQMRGDPGSTIRLDLQRRGGERYQVTLRREVVSVAAVDGELIGDGLAHVRLHAFQDDTARDLDTTLDKLEAKAGGHLEGVVLDLRNNPGGLVDEAVAVSDLFLDYGEIVRTKGRDPRANHVWNARRPGTRAPFPMVVLVNAGSASAAEIVAGALQDNHRAVVVGSPTFGKGSVQSLTELADGSGLKLTIAHYFTPSGRSIQATGIVPDVRIEADGDAAAPETAPSSPPMREADLDRHLANPGGAAPAPPPAAPADPVLARAVELLRAARILGGR